MQNSACHAETGSKVSFPSSFSLKSKLLGSWISSYYLHVPHLGNPRPRFGSGLSANYFSWKDTKELINSMNVLTMHINPVNLSRQIQVSDPNGKNSFSQAFAFPLQVQPPLSPRGIGSDSSLLCFVDVPRAQTSLFSEKMFLLSSQ